ncbi:PDC sensor domain-containing protein [Thioalkalivibrio paradoxus]|uniref:Uncharacterized protein n=1 Tax=Thioalkalivibrio paradoxus ARh 1 TaxID=713585 RepID=W0DGP8_9GAMM|nr:PDC sensor domain-containing protein [Thioalkalivibrio paradoxus]AHE97799.1 hypothetical protein THITH_05460 [Thioalkalivibrio paradoxus ARh 1]
MEPSLKDSIYLQRERLARILHEPLAQLAVECSGAWDDRERLNDVLRKGFCTIPHRTFLYCLRTDGIQISDNVAATGLVPEHFGRDRSSRPYMNEAVPGWGFLLSDAYISLYGRRPSITALQLVRTDDHAVLGYLGADFDLRDLPLTAELYEEPSYWRQIKGDPAIRGGVFQQVRVESPLDRSLDQSLAILDELLTQRGVFQCQVHFSSSQATVWTASDPLRYRLLDHEALNDPDVCLVYPRTPYPADAAIPQNCIGPILGTLRSLRLTDETFYLRMSSINLFNGMVSVTFSCDGSHYMRYDEFLARSHAFWFGVDG